MRIAASLTTVFVLTCTMARGASPQATADVGSRQALSQLVSQLKERPADEIIRREILKLGSTLKPAPAPTPEAERFLARGITAFEVAKSATDFTAAITEFQSAANAAPWWPDAYFNLGQAKEKAGDLTGAKSSYEYYLLGQPDAPDAAGVRSRVYRLEYLAEQKAKVDAAKAELESARQLRARTAEALIQQLRSAHSGRIVHERTCLVLSRPTEDWNCTETEMQENWRPILASDNRSQDLTQQNRRFIFSITGDGQDEVKVNWAGRESGALCGIPSSLKRTIWTECVNNNVGRARAYLNFFIASDGTPCATLYTDCKPDGRCIRWYVELER